jgi:hypothetical protein
MKRKKKIKWRIGEIFIITGFFLLIGVAGNSDYAVECGIYQPWYSGWQFLLLGIASSFIGTVLLKDWSEKFDR